MNNYHETELLLNGLDINGLYLKDVFSLWLQYDRSGQPYFTVFLINGSRISVPATPANAQLLQRSGVSIHEFIVANGSVQETPLVIDVDNAALLEHGSENQQAANTAEHTNRPH